MTEPGTKSETIPNPPPERRQPINPAWGTVIVAAVGIIATVVIAFINARYMASDHAADRAEAKAKELREASTKAYLAAIGAMRACQRDAERIITSSDQLQNVATKDSPISDDVASSLKLFGSLGAILCFDAAMSEFDVLRLTPPHSTERTDAAVKFGLQSLQFIQAARADIQSNRL